MAYLKLSSSLEKFSWVISKNPDSGMLAKSQRKGAVFGWYDEGAYCVCHLDKPQVNSYSQQSFNYLDVSAHTSPAAYMNMLTNVLKSAMSKQHKEDTGSANSITLGALAIKEKVLELFAKHYPAFTLIWEPITPGVFVYKVTITNSGTLYELLNFTNFLCVIAALKTRNCFVDFSPALVAKCLETMAAAKSPYFMVNIFKQSACPSRESFEYFKATMESACIEEVKLQQGNLWQQRFRWVKQNLKLKGDLVDLGAGELSYWKLAQKVKGLYYPIEQDAELREVIDNMRRKKEIEAEVTEPFESWQAFAEQYTGNGAEVLVTEVLEHNLVQDAILLLSQVLDTSWVTRVIGTVPNKEFNQYYGLSDEETRHDDHKWESTLEELDHLLVIALFAGGNNMPNWTIQTVGIGDSVNGVQPTTGFVFERICTVQSEEGTSAN